MRRGTLLVAATALLAASLALELAGSHAGAAGVWHTLPGFDFLYGLAGCAAIVVVSKALGKLGLQKPESWDEEGG